MAGVYRTTGEGVTVFHPVPALTSEQLPALLDKIISRILRVLTRQGHLVEEEGVTYVADAHGVLDPENGLAPLQAASCTYRIAFGPRAGRKALSWQYAASRAAPMPQQLCANAHGFSLHAGVRCTADQRQALEHLCRYVTRPAIAIERLSVNRAGQVVLKLKTPYRDGTSHFVMSPLEFMQSLAALVPRPRLHLIRFHGVLAPHARLRAAVVPTPALICDRHLEFKRMHCQFDFNLKATGKGGESVDKPVGEYAIAEKLHLPEPFCIR